MSAKYKTAEEAEAAIGKRNKMVLMVLLAVLGIFLTRVGLKSDGLSSAKASTSKKSVSKAPETTASTASAIQKKVITLDVQSDQAKHLFQLAPIIEAKVAAEIKAAAPAPVQAPTISTEGLKLESTIVSGQASIAIVNGQLYRLGQQINGLTVTEIQQRAIQLESNGLTATLTINAK